ncbi:MoxR family ATPase [Candidatus Woesearchaeota archaeon]|nr:MoxR family ATPase [Candidatus Woesearchaeota archaeon]
MDKEISALSEQAKKYSTDIEQVRAEMQKVIVGKTDVIDKLIIALISGGHVFLEGAPGLAKTQMIKTLSETLDASFQRIQFTPDLLPADIIGTKIYNHKENAFKTQKGPIFAQFILADEINRAPPKVQSALLEAMQEKQVTISGETYKLERPFFVLATQNPIETEGTYRLPEAQVDRFMFKLLVDYPHKEDEKEIMRRYTTNALLTVKKVLPLKRLMQMQEFCRNIYCDEQIFSYVADIIDATRDPKAYELDLDKMIEYGASPRATIWLIVAAKAYAMLHHRGYVIPEDVQDIAYDVLRHRIVLTYEAEAEELTSDAIITQILEKIKVP